MTGYGNSPLFRERPSDFWYLVGAFGIVLGREAGTAKEAGEQFSRLVAAGDIECWTWLQAFLSASGTVSRLLWLEERAKRPHRLRMQDARAVREALRELVGDIKSLDSLRSRDLRDNFEHIDERIEEWFLDSGRGAFVDGVLADSAGQSSTWLASHDSEQVLRSIVIDRLTVYLRGRAYEIKPMLVAVSALADASDDAVRAAGTRVGAVVAIGGPTGSPTGVEYEERRDKPSRRGNAKGSG